MHPELFHIGHLTIYSYGFMIVAGIAIAYFYLKQEWGKIGLTSELVSSFFLYSIAGVFIGGKIFYFLERPAVFAENPGLFFKNIGNGFVFYGSFLVTIPVLIAFFKKHQLNVWEQFDRVAIGGAVVHGFGKIGCYLAGCCYGLPCGDAWYATTFSDAKTAALPLNQPVYATQLWDATIIGLILLVMLFLKKRKSFNGQLFLVYAIFYAIGRFFTERFRGDEERGFLFDGLLSHSQFLAIIIMLCAGTLYYYRNRNNQLLHTSEAFSHLTAEGSK